MALDVASELLEQSKEFDFKDRVLILFKIFHSLRELEFFFWVE